MAILGFASNPPFAAMGVPEGSFKAVERRSDPLATAKFAHFNPGTASLDTIARCANELHHGPVNVCGIGQALIL